LLGLPCDAHGERTLTPALFETLTIAITQDVFRD
jgi:hypothetical protein